MLSLILREGVLRHIKKGADDFRDSSQLPSLWPGFKELMRVINLGPGIVSLREHSLFTSQVLYDLK